MTGFLWALSILLVLLGIAGTVLPVLPGAVLVFLGLLLAAWIDGFAKVGVVTVGILAFMVLLSSGIDFVSTGLGARRAGASKLAVTGAAIGTLCGLFFGLPGIIIGPFLGAVLGEFISRRDVRQAGKAGFASWLGFVVGVAAKLDLVFLMIGLFVTSHILS